jgi:hypothetical protein
MTAIPGPFAPREAHTYVCAVTTVPNMCRLVCEFEEEERRT